MWNDLRDRHAFVTGSTSGIGEAIADGLLEAGVTVLRHGRDESEVTPDQSAIHDYLFQDLSGPLPDVATEVVKQALRADPKIDLLVCNAGIYIDQPFLEMPFSTFQKTLNVNVGSVFAIVQAFARHWIEQKTAGRIVVTGSINGRLSEPTHVAYDTSKGAVEAMVRSLAVTLAPHEIRVNGVAPGLFETPLTGPAINSNGLRQWMELHTPNGKVPSADAAVGTVAFLLSEASEHMVGQMLFVDGGMSIWQQPDPPA